jgi:aspartate beta-hydroxylase
MGGVSGVGKMAEISRTVELTARAKDALYRGDARAALQIFAGSSESDLSLEALLDKALAQRMVGELNAAVSTLDAALALDPQNFLALLSKGALLERLGHAKAAAHVYMRAVAIAPPAHLLAETLTRPLARARDVVGAHSEALAAHLRASVAPLRAQFAGQSLERFDESLEIFAGLKRPYVQEPLLLTYPRLPAIPFFERDQFPWLGDLEAATPIIREEVLALMTEGVDHLAPYIEYPPGVPVNQWGELNHSRRWSACFLWRDGVRQDEICTLCPRTAALMEGLPMARQAGFAPTVTVSVLEPHTRIPPHTGSANTRLLVHLPLVLPGPARFRVGNVTREWRMGEAWVFDDTIEHEAWNDADEPRAILIFDIWNPFLSEAERTLVSAMMTAKNQFQASD